MPIVRLTEELAGKIAAGEVIDRPVAVVKELVENAIDAGSRAIEVEIQGGGLERIVVRDDGEGMAREDLVLCVERHTTSKIRSEDDLAAIRTLGFRGEALASIASVSHLRVTSRAQGDEDAWAVLVVAGRTEKIAPEARAAGTTVDVERLFFNLPARAKFLGAPRTEALHVHRAVERLALTAPEVSFVLRHDGREVLATPCVPTLVDRAAQVYGAEVSRGLITLDGRRGAIRVTGCVSGRDVKRGTRRDQLFIVNGRAVSDRGLGYVLASAYGGILRPGSFPIAVIAIDLPPEQVDVNVHPRKEEVRFAAPREVQDALASTLHQALSSPQMIGTMASAPRVDGTVASGPSADRVRERPVFWGEGDRAPTFPGFAGSVLRTAATSPDLHPTSDRRVVGQLHDTYLLVEAPDGLEIVDQHILHERVLYEKLREDLAAEGIARQLFLLPARVELPFESASILSEHLEALAELGVVIEAFGGGTFLLREYPRRLADDQTPRGFQEVVDALVEVLREGHDPGPTLFEELLRTLACGAAVKAGERLPLVDAQALLDQLWQTENPYSCPHGRPIIVHLGREELDRRFGRR
ncbi:MAG: DNA mismatch repair endonuclease MutL [Candidatus Bipolaricaulota bacterium]